MAKSEIKRTPTGIKGFDKIVEGGLPENSISLVSGTPGTAKTIFAMQFIANGALKNKEKGIFITLEEDTKGLIRQFKRFGYDLEKLVNEGKIKIIEVDTSFKTGDPFTKITNAQFIADLKDFNPDRIAVDSLSLIMELSSPEGGRRRAVGELADMFRGMGATSLLIHERSNPGLESIQYSIDEFVCDGMIHLQLHMTEYVLQRFLTVIKMRETNQSTGVYPFKINEQGIELMDLRGLMGK